MDLEVLINFSDDKSYTTQAEYAKNLRRLIPCEAFEPDFSKVWILIINVTILIIGWEVAAHLSEWNSLYLWLYLPLALVMGNSVIVLLFGTHDLLHSQAIKNPLLRRAVSLVGLTLLWMPPTLWKAVHNREHHSKTNSIHDPDRNYMFEQPRNWGKWIQNLFVPSVEVYPPFLVVGMAHAWGIHTFRNLSSVLFFNGKSAEYPSATFKISSKEHRAIVLELLAIIGLHFCILMYLGFQPINLLFGYFLPIWIGHSGLMFYIYTNHMLCRMTPINDPLVNSISLQVPKIFDLLHFNFSYHTEHHIFPGLNSDYYPAVQVLLKSQYPDKFNLLSATEAWALMLKTPRHYKDANTFTDWQGEKNITCPLSPMTSAE